MRLGVPASARSSPWLLVAVGFAALAVSFSVRAILGLAMPVIGPELLWSRSFISGIGALALIVTGLAAPLAGRIIDIRGPRLLLSGGLICIAIGSALVAVSSSSIAFTLGFGVICAIGFTGVGTNVLAAAIARRFQAGRGLAIGIGTAGATAGQLVVVPIVAMLMQKMSWRVGFLALAAISVALACLAFAMLPRGAGQSDAQAIPESGSFFAHVGALLRLPAFHVLFWSFLICGFTTTGVIETHLLSYANFCGFPPLPSALAYGVLSAANMVGMAAAGYLSDRMNRPLLLASIYLFRSASFFLLLHVAPDIRLLYVFAVLFGAVDYSTVPVTVGLAASHIGMQRLGLALGLISSGHALGASMGALAGGFIYDALGSYGWLWSVALTLSAVAGFLVLSLNDKPVAQGNRSSDSIVRAVTEG